MKKLYLAYMWWRSLDRLMEDHEILMIVAENEEKAKNQAKEKTKLLDEVHIDMIIEVNNIDWYNIILEKWWIEDFKKISDYSKI